jgi:cytochrome c-type biogenesis protein CcsB
MDLDAVAEWARYMVACACIAFSAAWLMLGAELAARARAKRAESAAAAPTPEAALAGVGATATVSQSADVSAGTGQSDVSTIDTGTVDAGTADVERADRYARSGAALVTLATIVLAAGVVMRAVGTGRAPWGNMFEFSISAALIASVAVLVLLRKPSLRPLAIWVVLPVFVTLGLAVTVLYVPPGPLVPALRSYWLVLHVGCAVAAFGLFTVAAIVSALQLVSERSARKGLTSGLGSILPESDVLDRLAYRLNAIAFPIWTFGPLILGAIWAEVSWGRYWGWDPKEVWALITWLVFAAYLHARATAGWRGSRASIVGLIGFGTALFSYYGVNVFFSGLHSYGGL